uniref:Uncharacterized protein n=1 Tax=Rhizophora mucronata TaxID=61149 RepID=A0A2P2NUY1_RHIMU
MRSSNSPNQHKQITTKHLRISNKKV